MLHFTPTDAIGSPQILPLGLVVPFHILVMCSDLVSNLLQFVIENGLQYHFENRKGHGNEYGQENLQPNHNCVIPELAPKPK